MSNKYLDVVESSDGMNPVFLVKRDDIGKEGRHVAYKQNQAERLYKELGKELESLGVIEK